MSREDWKGSGGGGVGRNRPLDHLTFARFCRRGQKFFQRGHFQRPPDLFDNFLFHFTSTAYCRLINGLSDKDSKRYSCNLFPLALRFPREALGQGAGPVGREAEGAAVN